MKKIVTGVVIVILLSLIIGCGGGNPSTNTEDATTTISVSIDQKNLQKSLKKSIYQKTSNLAIASIKIDVYDAPTGGTLIASTFLTQHGTLWSGTIGNVSTGTDLYLFAHAYNNDTPPVEIYTGSSGKVKLNSGSTTSISIALSQSETETADLKLFSVSSIITVNNGDGTYNITFNIANPNEEDLTYTMMETTNNQLSTQFSPNSGNILAGVVSTLSVVYTEGTYQDFMIRLKNTNDERSDTLFTIYKNGSVNISIAVPIITGNPDRMRNGTSYRMDWSRVVTGNDTYTAELEDISGGNPIGLLIGTELNISGCEEGVSFKVKFTATNATGGSSFGLYPVVCASSSGAEDPAGTHTHNGLMWQDDIEAKTVMKRWITPDNYNAGDYYNTSGDTATTCCSELTLAGFTDWRLPTIDELKGIVDKTNSPTIVNGFNNVTSYFYWSSTTGASDSSYTWDVSFYDGNDYWDHRTYEARVRCVRGGQ